MNGVELTCVRMILISILIRFRELIFTRLEGQWHFSVSFVYKDIFPRGGALYRLTDEGSGWQMNTLKFFGSKLPQMAVSSLEEPNLVVELPLLTWIKKF